MKICIVCPGWPGRVNQWNGIFIQEQAKNLVKNGCELSVVTARVYKDDPTIEMDGDIKINRFWFPSKGKLLAEYEKIPVLRIVLYLFFGIVKTCRIVSKEKINVIHAHWAIPTGFIGVISAKIMRRPVILTAHDSDITVWSQKSFLANKIIRFTLKKANLIIAVTSILKNFMVKRLGTNSNKISVVPLGIDTDLFKPKDQKSARQQLHLPQDKDIALFIGGLLEIKGIRYLMQAIPRLLEMRKNLYFVLLGSGHLEVYIKNEIEKNHVSHAVMLCGPKNHTQIPLWLAASNVLLLPSLSEGLGMVISEALAMGIPVIASKVGGIPKIVTHNYNGFLISPGDVESLVENIDLFFSDKKISESLKKNAALDQGLDNKLSANKIMEIYCEINQG